ncbi:MAG: glycine betaine ABC transporter substrate-binding protein [Acidimicrobiales bacterium]|nr:glycine betaine ABC transporter substrate-binding protein [Acidimicrobiales bacterium]
MKKNLLTRGVAVAAAALLLLAACGSDDDSSSDSSSDTVASAPATTEAAAINMTPGEGVSVTAGRASWSTGYVQAEIFTALLRELGYTVSESADMELGPQNAFMAMAEGDMDFWANSWMPGHTSWLLAERTDGSLVGDNVTVLGMQIQAGGLQGFLIEKGFADEYGVYTLEDLNSNADAIAAYDATDANPGNGLVDMFGCPEDWTCDNIINSMLVGAGLDNIVQVKAGYDPMWAQATDMVNEGLPTLAYTWTPSAYITTIRPGDNAYWMGHGWILDDSNPNNQEGGEAWDQRPGSAAIGEDMCPARNDEGLCPIGWAAADIQAAANNDFLAANPAAEELFKQIVLSVMDVSVANLAQSEGAAPPDLAVEWIANNRDKVDVWLDAARAAAG